MDVDKKKTTTKRKVSKKVPVYDKERNIVLQFREDYEFLSNFYPCPNGVEYEGVKYPTSENAYQASKTSSFRRRIFINCSPKEAKRKGKNIPMIYGFDRVKAMRKILFSKFTRNSELKQKLLGTRNITLAEGNIWNDTFWGINLKAPCKNCEFFYEGKNMLGKLLMELRKELKKSI